MNGQPKMRFEQQGEEMFNALPPADTERFERGEYEPILADLKILPQEDQRNAIRAYVLAATEAMTKTHNLGVTATTSQEAEGYHEQYARLTSFYEGLMRLNHRNDE